MSRDVLSPPLLRMSKNRSYRVNQIHSDFGGNPRAKAQGTRKYTEEDMYADEEDDECKEGASYTIEEIGSPTIYKLMMHVASPFYGGIIGFKGSTKKRIESETQTEIVIPRTRELGTGKTLSQPEKIVVKGKTRASVCAAHRRINLLVTSLRQRMRPTHFLCVPLSNGEILSNFTTLKERIVAANLPNIDENIFQTGGCIHLTLGTCILMDDQERAKAAEVLEDCRKLLMDLKTPFVGSVSGLEIMNDDPSSVRVLYARVHDAPDLQEFANRALKRFIQSGFAFKEFNRDSVKLHMTIMNVKYLQYLNPKAPNNFDAREVLKQYSDFNFGTFQCNEIQLCVLSSSKMGEAHKKREAYKATATLKF